MIGVSVRSTIKSVIADFRAETAAIEEKATVRALNRALDQAATGASREIRKVYNIKHRVVMRALKKDRARKGKLTATLHMSGARIPLIEFAARWTRKTRVGASVQVKVGGGRKRIRGAFIGVHGYTGARQVFVRRGKQQYPIKSLRSVSVPQAFSAEAVIAAIQALARESFTRNFQQQLRYLSTRG